MHAVFLDEKSLNRDDLSRDALLSIIQDWTFYPETDAADVNERIANAHIVVSNKVCLGEEHFKNNPDLELIAVAATGTNNIDLEAATHYGITVVNVRRYGTASVVQHVIGVMIALCRHTPNYQQAIREGRWQQSDQFCLFDYPIRELGELTLGIIGYGELGRHLAETVKSTFGMQVLVANRPGTDLARDRILLDELLPQVDILTIHTPLTPQTQNLISTAQLSQMKPTAFLINAARGGIVDEQALADALRDHTIAGAAVDTLTTEPPIDGNPLLSADIPNLILTPHIAWASRAARQRLQDMVADNIRAYLAGNPVNKVN
jgi:glycerate dehydrogenase